MVEMLVIAISRHALKSK